MYWCWWDFHQERSPQQRPGDSHCLLTGHLLRNNQIQEAGWWLRARGTSQSPRNWPCPQALSYSWIGSKSFFLQKLLGGLCVDAEQKNFWHLKKSSGIGSLFLPQLFLLKSLIQQELEISEEKTAKNIIAKSPSSQFICEHWSMPVSQADQSTDYFA